MSDPALKCNFHITDYRLYSWALLVLLFSGEYHRAPFLISQHWFRKWLGTFRQQPITWANVDPDLTRPHWVNDELDCSSTKPGVFGTNRFLLNACDYKTFMVKSKSSSLNLPLENATSMASPRTINTDSHAGFVSIVLAASSVLGRKLYKQTKKHILSPKIIKRGHFGEIYNQTERKLLFRCSQWRLYHQNDDIFVSVNVLGPKIIGKSRVSSTTFSGEQWAITVKAPHYWPLIDSPHKGTVMRKTFQCHGVINSLMEFILPYPIDVVLTLSSCVLYQFSTHSYFITMTS